MNLEFIVTGKQERIDLEWKEYSYEVQLILVGPQKVEGYLTVYSETKEEWERYKVGDKYTGTLAKL